jgi:cysteine desulfurase / selenocysteine lyase
MEWSRMDLNKVRLDFPLFQNDNNHKKPVYLDSACQSLRPQSVLDAIIRYYRDEPACGGRSNHHLSEAVTRQVDQTRTAAARFFHAPHKEEIIFTRNTTEGINLVANSIGLKPGDTVLISDKEHNSNLIPWQMQVKRTGIRLKVIPSLPDNTFNMPAFEKLLDPGVKLVSLGFTSNLDGVTIPAAQIIKAAHQNGALVMLDAAQAAPHRSIDVKGLDVDFLALSGHKMLGPSGTGILYGKLPLLEKLTPFLVGGDTVASSTYETCEFLPPPEKFEAGLQDYAGIYGLGAALDYLQKIGFDSIQKQETLLNEFITSEIISLPGLKIIGPADSKLRGGIVTFYFDGIDSHKVALMLDQMAGVMVRSGQHCVHSWFNSHQIKGSVRASMYFYNTMEDAEIFTSNLKKIRKVL